MSIDVPLRIERNAVAREKFGVTWDKLAEEYRSCLRSLEEPATIGQFKKEAFKREPRLEVVKHDKAYNKANNVINYIPALGLEYVDFKLLEKYYNRDGTRKRLKFGMDAIIGVVLLTILFSSPSFTVFVSDVIWYRMIPIPWTMLVGIITYNLLKPHIPASYCWSGYVIKNEFDRYDLEIQKYDNQIQKEIEAHDLWNQNLNTLTIEREALEAKFSDIDSICGGNSSVEYKLQKLK